MYYVFMNNKNASKKRIKLLNIWFSNASAFNKINKIS
jgi:hypothetical protein